MKKKKCKCEYLKWVGDGDRRLYCPICKKLYVLYDGEPIEIKDSYYPDDL